MLPDAAWAVPEPEEDEDEEPEASAGTEAEPPARRSSPFGGLQGSRRGAAQQVLHPVTCPSAKGGVASSLLPGVQ